MTEEDDDYPIIIRRSVFCKIQSVITDILNPLLSKSFLKDKLNGIEDVNAKPVYHIFQRLFKVKP